jgi:Kiwa KwaB-like protein
VSASVLHEQLRADLAAIVAQAHLSADLHLVKGPRDPEPAIHKVPTDEALAQELVAMCALSARAAVDGEFIVWQPDYKAGSNQRIIRALGDDPLSILDARLRQTMTFPDYSDQVALSESGNLLIIRLFTDSAQQLARFYQKLGTAKTLEKARRKLLLWQGDTFSRIETQTLVLDDNLRLAVTEHGAIMTQPSVYELLFGALPELASQAQETYKATLAPLDIEGGAELAEACSHDINMMRKLASIELKLQDPAYRTRLTQDSLVKFIRSNPHVDVELVEINGQIRIKYDKRPQRRWAILKLLDDDFLRSELTDTDYVSNSKSRS